MHIAELILQERIETVVFRISPDMKDLLKVKAKAKGMNMSGYIHWLIVQDLEKTPCVSRTSVAD